jgi:hypothetical protein
MTVSRMNRTAFERSPTRRCWRHWGIAALVGIGLAIGNMNAGIAADDDDEAPDTKFFRSLLTGLGLRKDGDGIDYRERSPLVLPPGHELRPPEPGQAKKTAAWPNDPDVKRAKQRKQAEKNFVRDPEDGARPALPSEYGRPNPPARKDGGLPSKSAEESAAPSTLKELGSKGIFSGNGWFAPSEEYSTFGGEPPRASLTEPPAGYRTPSPNQPYGVGKEKWKAPVVDRAAGDTR